MNKIQLPVLCCIVFFLFSTLLQAQNPSPHWASQIYNSSSDVFGSSGLATDKEGNVYTLVSAPSGGYMNANGHTTPNSDVTTVLISWDCDHNFRWMKAFGGTAFHQDRHLGVDTLGGSIFQVGFIVIQSRAMPIGIRILPLLFP